MKNLLLIFIGGGIGSVLRYALQHFMRGVTWYSFPYGTFLVNIIGCFFIGFFAFYIGKHADDNLQWRLFLITGLCGGFTTFFAFSYENMMLINDHRIFVFFTYTIGSVALCIIATYFGVLAARNI